MQNATARNGDPLAIRYLDGSTTASPYRVARVEERRAALHALERQSVPTGRLLAALSTALDLTEGQLPGHVLRTCFLATRLADRMRASAGEHLAADVIEALVGTLSDQLFEKLTRNSSEPESAIEMMNPPTLGAPIE